jgi:hypothetical protein
MPAPPRSRYEGTDSDEKRLHYSLTEKKQKNTEKTKKAYEQHHTKNNRRQI